MHSIKGKVITLDIVCQPVCPSPSVCRGIFHLKSALAYPVFVAFANIVQCAVTLFLAIMGNEALHSTGVWHEGWTIALKFKSDICGRLRGHD